MSWRKRVRSRAVSWRLVIVLVALSFVILVVLALPFRRKDGVGRAVDVEIAAVESDEQIVVKFEVVGVIDSVRVFVLYARARGGIDVKPGRHLLSDDLSAVEVLCRIRRSHDAAKIRVTIPEGYHRFDIAKRLQDKRICDQAFFLAATIDPVLLNEVGLGALAEGWLFFAPYDFLSNSDVGDVV